jgi:hypothetical protein
MTSFLVDPHGDPLPLDTTPAWRSGNDVREQLDANCEHDGRKIADALRSAVTSADIGKRGVAAAFAQRDEMRPKARVVARVREPPGSVVADPGPALR